jgi:hypothetical protein
MRSARIGPMPETSRSRNRCGVPDSGHQVAVPSRLDTENTEAVLSIVVGDPLDEAGQHFLSR